jgi:flagellar basal-body rod modification protein FlgD
VTGINNLTDTVTSLLDQFAQMQSLQAAQLTGRNVLVEGNDLTLGESGAVGGIELESAADAVKVEIYDANGTLVRTLDLGAEEAGDFGFTWDGKDDAGQALDAGTYTFKVAATNSGKEVDATALAIRTVDGVRRDGTTLQLLLAGHGSVAYSDIKLIV